MSSANDLAKMVPGFEFLQNLMKGASAGLPGVQGFGQWVAPTLDPAELDKRIQELKTVQFWLEQNARLLGGTIQALEVQRMTLATLQTMNLPMAELAESLRARPSPAPAPAPATAAPSWARPAPASPAAPAAATPDNGDNAGDDTPAADAAPAAAKPAAIDPMQWWGALTQQFTEIAAQAVKEGSAVASAAAAVASATAAPGPAAGAGSKAKAPAGRSTGAADKPAGRKTASRSPAKAAPRKRAA